MLFLVHKPPMSMRNDLMVVYWPISPANEREIGNLDRQKLMRVSVLYNLEQPLGVESWI